MEGTNNEVSSSKASPIASPTQELVPGTYSEPATQKLPIDPSDFELIALAGKGAFGKVWVVRRKNDFHGKVMAMKVISKQRAVEGQSVTHTLLEREFLTQLGSHPFIVDLYLSFQTDTNIYLVMEYLPGGHLFSYVQEMGIPWPEDHCRFYGAEVLLALEFMHEHNVIYRDLKLENILMDMDGHIRLTDFGLSNRIQQANDRIHSLSGTAAYLAPEMLDKDKGHSKGADLWAYGVMMFILLLHESPFYSENAKELLDFIRWQEIEWDWYKDEISPNALSLLKGLLTKDETQRLGCGPQGMLELKSHPFFEGIVWEDILQMRIKPPINPKLRVAQRASAEDKADFLESKVAPMEYPEFANFSFVASCSYLPQYFTPTMPTPNNGSRIGSPPKREISWPFPEAIPDLIVQKILEFLTLADIFTACQVSKGWNQFLRANLKIIDLASIPEHVFKKYWSSQISKLLQRTARLEKLCMHPGISDEDMEFLPRMKELKILRFRGCTKLTSLKAMTFRKPAKPFEPKRRREPHFPNLKKLDLSGCLSLDDYALEYLSVYSQITQISLKDNFLITDSGLSNLLRLKALWRVNLHGLVYLTDAGIRQLVRLPNLRVLDLTGCSGLSGVGVEAFRHKAKRLEVLIWNEPVNPATQELEKERNKKPRGLFRRRKKPKGKSKLPNPFSNFKKNTPKVLDVHPNFDDERFQHYQVIHTKSRSVDWTPDPNLLYSSNWNLPDEFAEFSPPVPQVRQRPKKRDKEASIKRTSLKIEKLEKYTQMEIPGKDFFSKLKRKEAIPKDHPELVVPIHALDLDALAASTQFSRARRTTAAELSPHRIMVPDLEKPEITIGAAPNPNLSPRYNRHTLHIGSPLELEKMQVQVENDLDPIHFHGLRPTNDFAKSDRRGSGPKQNQKPRFKAQAVMSPIPYKTHSRKRSFDSLTSVVSTKEKGKTRIPSKRSPTATRRNESVDVNDSDNLE